VTAVGGEFFITNVDNFFLIAPVTITLSDGTITTYTPASRWEFRGFVSEGPIITSLILSAPGVGNYNTLDNLIVGAAVPEPSSMLLLGFSFLTFLAFLAKRR